MGNQQSRDTPLLPITNFSASAVQLPPPYSVTTSAAGRNNVSTLPALRTPLQLPISLGPATAPSNSSSYRGRNAQSAHSQGIQQLPPCQQDYYDVVMDVTTIEDLQKPQQGLGGWAIAVSPRFEELLADKHSEEEALAVLDLDKSAAFIGVLGLFNRGKTFVVNALADAHLPSDKKIRTRGISFMLSRGTAQCIYGDTAGSSSPLGQVDRDHEMECLAQKQSTELLTQEIVFSISDILILVVSELTWPDEQFLKTVQKRLQEPENTTKELYVVHNFSDMEDIAECCHTFSRCVVGNLRGELKAVPVGNKELPFFKEQTGSTLVTVHVFLGKAGSPAGCYWNPLTFDFLKECIKTNLKPSRVPLYELMTSKTREALGVYCKSPTNVTIHWNKDEHTPSRAPPIPLVPPLETFLLQDGKINLGGWTKSVPQKDSPLRGHFYLCAEGDLRLIADKVDYNGYRILLLSASGKEFTPKYDAIRTDGLEVIFDVPGIRPDRDIGGTIEIPQIVRDSSSSKLIFKGHRQLYHCKYESSNGEYKPSELVPYGNDKPKFLEQSTSYFSHCRGESGFMIEVPIPQDVEDTLENADLWHEEGLYHIYLPPKKTKKEVKVHSTRTTLSATASK